MKYLFAMMDDDTRFWIVQEVADTKHSYDARRLFRKARDMIGRRPKTLITDGLPSYREAYMKEFYTHKLETRTEHIHSIRIQGDRNNNKMERLNGEIRDREKVIAWPQESGDADHSGLSDLSQLRQTPSKPKLLNPSRGLPQE